MPKTKWINSTQSATYNSRWAKRTQQNIENYPKWHGINWRDIAGYATLVADELEAQNDD